MKQVSYHKNTTTTKQVTMLGAMNIYNDDISIIIEELHMKHKFDKEFDICLIFKCDFDEHSSSSEQENEE